MRRRRSNRTVFMKKSLAILVLALTFGSAFAADDASLADVRKKVAETFESIGEDDVYASPVDGWYMIQKNSIVAYISADGRYLLQGDLIDLDAQVNLSEDARNTARRAVIERLPDEQTITFSPPEVRHSITVFTDVECTYCRRLHSQIDEYLDAGIEVRYLLYPRQGPASRAWTTSENVWCSSDRQRALTAAKLDREFESRQCDASAVQDHYVLGREVGLTGTPAIVLEDGTLIAGYVPPVELAKQLDAEKARVAATR